MNRKWTSIVTLGACLAILVVGCRTPQPDLKPPKQPEVFNPPSDVANLTSYPKEAFASSNNQRNQDPGSSSAGSRMGQPASFGGPSGGMPGGGGMGGGGMGGGGMGGMGGMGGVR